MAKRYIGDAVIEIKYHDAGDYRGKISVVSGGKPWAWHFEDLHAPAAGLGAGVAYDSPEAYDRMAASAVSFASYYTTHNRGADTPDWAPTAELADAIAENTEWATDEEGRGLYEVKRSFGGQGRYRDNPGRPPGKWMRHCIDNVRASGTAKDPRAVCGSLWFHKMGKEEKRLALRREDRNELALLSNPTGGEVAAIAAAVAALGLAAWWLFKPKTAQAASLPACSDQLYAQLDLFRQEKGYDIFYDEVTTDITTKGPPANPQYIAAGANAREWDVKLCGFYKWTGKAWVKDDATNTEFDTWTAAQILKEQGKQPSPSAQPSSAMPASNPNSSTAVIPCPVTQVQLDAFGAEKNLKVFTKQTMDEAPTIAPHDPTWRMFLQSTCSLYVWQINEWVHDLQADADLTAWLTAHKLKLPAHYVHGVPDPAAMFIP